MNYNKKRRDARKALGMCRDCFRDATRGTSRCDHCRDRQLELWRRKMSRFDLGVPYRPTDPTKITRMLELAAITNRRIYL